MPDASPCWLCAHSPTAAHAHTVFPAGMCTVCRRLKGHMAFRQLLGCAKRPILVPPRTLASAPVLILSRHLAKKGKASGKGGKGAKASKDDEDSGAEEVDEVDLDALGSAMEKSFNHLQRELGAMQAGRATPNMLDSVQVTLHGDKVPLPSLAKVLVQGSNALQISVFDGANSPAICKAIENAELNLTPEAVGKTIRVAVPRPTKEMRMLLIKQIKKAGETCRNHIRTHRQAAMKQAKAHSVKETVKRQEKEVQKIHDTYISKVDAAVDAKEKEVMSV
ncbi:hypothetical protein AB1Y20_022380 [Prymnesium parvum]|uniref:Ribosome recycling factor domain-containing protein n=1 Tax=Prymnesium parvum TaxID=97485 RepID=A0AB34JGZ8_PRYPA